MNKKVFALIIFQTVIIVGLVWVLVFFGKDEYEAAQREDEIATPSRVTQENGAAVVTLSVQAQKISGIAATPLKPANFQAERVSYGSVVGIEPLTELRARYQAALADANVVRASLANSQQDYQRMQVLNKDNRNVSDRALQAAEATWKADQARLVAAETLASGIRDSMRQQWGDVLTGWATQPAGNEAFQRLLQYRDVLLRVTLPTDTVIPSQHSVLQVEPIGAQGQASQAQWISASPQTDTTVQGKTYFYRAPADNLRAGMRVTARFTGQGKSAAGVIVPHTAVVWYASQAWVYQQQGADKFVRCRINTDVEADDQSGAEPVNGWFNTTGIKAGDVVVTRGAQLLLSEELKAEIKNENED